tara:strand:- start:4734 stop:4982 length:249 start_codon:yes stop_codon:yes gene_type:complete
MAINIDGKKYDETKLDEKCKTSVIQVSNLQKRLRDLSTEFDNVKVLIKHHSDYLTANLPASALLEDKANSTDKTAETTTTQA